MPPGFRPNAVFVGMQRELQLLDQHLFDDRREFGTASVLIHGHPGSGKSHVARQYIHENRQKFPGGIFWINAHLIGEVEHDFWQIAQKVVAKVSPELMLPLQDSKRGYADIVREWFESRQEWLIVLDGIAVEKQADFNKLQAFIPNSANSNIMYISRSRRFEAVDPLLNPLAVKIRPLGESDGRDLLFKELHIDRPRPAQIKSATELVTKIGGLPLAINAIARRIADTHVPIEKYSIKSYSTDPILGGTYRVVMDDLRKNRHATALNLISIISFFGPHIPVEMIHLGMRALKMASIEIASSENGEEADLNISFGILMRHALIERNEPDDTSSLSGSHDSLVEPEPIDMLKMHTVIQRFCMDSLNASRRLPIWLNHACQLFICSYHEADARIRSRSEPARVSDYRQYAIHGEQLRQHTVSYESKRQSLSHLRAQLDGVLKDISERIKSMEPQSSQESIVQIEFQCSIFDRTNTSSSSSNSQSDDRTPGDSSPHLSAGDCEYADPASRRESGSSARSKELQHPTGPSTGGPPWITSSPITGEGEQPTSQPMQRSSSDTPTIRPSEGDLNSGRRIKYPSFSTPVATVSKDAATGTNFKIPEPKSNSAWLPWTALSSLTSFQRSDDSVSKGSESFWAWPLSQRQEKAFPGFAGIGDQSKSSEAASARHLARGASAPAQSGFQLPENPSSHGRGRTEPNSGTPPRASARSQFGSESGLAKSPAAAPSMSSSNENLYWENTASSQQNARNPETTATVTLVPSSSTLIASPTNLRRPIYLGTNANSLPQDQTRPSISSFSSQPPPRGSVSVENAREATVLRFSSDFADEMVGVSVAPRALDSTLQQITLPQTHQHQGLDAHVSLSRNSISANRQSPQTGSRKLNDSPRFLLLDGSSAQQSPQFASTNSSPTAPPHMFSSNNSDFGPAARSQDPGGNAQPSMAAMLTNANNWQETSVHAMRPQIRSAPIDSSEFSSSATLVTSAPLSAEIVSSTPGTPVSSVRGLGIAELPEQIPITGLTVVPPSDPRRRLRARQGRLTERDVNVLIRRPSEEEHPLAPKEEPTQAMSDPNTALLTLNSPDGQTIIASTDLRAWKPLERNVGTRSSAPYPEVSRFPAGGQNVSVNALMADLEPNHRRRRSAPESPGWCTVRDDDGWLGRG